MLRDPESRTRRARRAVGLFGSVLVGCALAFSSASLATTQGSPRTGGSGNVELSAEIAEGHALLEKLQDELAALRKEGAALDQSMARIERHAGVYALGREFVRTLTEERNRLPGPERFERARAARNRLLASTSDSNLRVERRLDALRDGDAAAQASLGEQIGLLSRLDSVQNEILLTLRAIDQEERELERAGELATTRIIGYLFWTPAPPSTKTFGEMLPALGWMVSPGNWSAAVTDARNELTRRPFLPAITFLLAVALLASRGRLRLIRESLTPAAVTMERYRIGHVLAALGTALALALPGPLALWAAGDLMAAIPDPNAFGLALGDALRSAAKMMLAIALLAQLFDGRGVLSGHFGADGNVLGHAATALTRFAWIFLPLMFIAALNGLEHAPFGNRESLGRLSFSLAMIALAILQVQLFRRQSPIMQRLAAQAPRSWIVQLHGVWFYPIAAAPLAIAAFAAAGYFLAAGYFFGRIVYTIFIALGAAVLYGLLALWVQVQRARLTRSEESRAAERMPSEDMREAGLDAAMDAQFHRLDIVTLGDQTRSLFNVLITLVLLAGIWWVWREAIPALSAIGAHALWSSATIIDGKTVVTPLTVDHLVLAMLIAVITVVAVRNVGALLDIMLLQRLEVKADATYAIKVTTKYGLTLAGILAACKVLGFAWSDVQWLAAALGVGLGFGLQEIVANFISGLILLAERPVRIGDIVTVGDASGTVAQIRARATTLVDFERREIIIPNKAFITGSVINWTLSDRVARLSITVGVARGSDVARVQRLLLDVLEGNPEVLREPAPSVFLTSLGEGLINFEVRAFVGSFDSRLRVQHEIYLAADRTLRENGIETSSPLRDLQPGQAAGPQARG